MNKPALTIESQLAEFRRQLEAEGRAGKRAEPAWNAAERADAYRRGRIPIEGLREPHAADCQVEFDDPDACTCGRREREIAGP